MLGSGDAFGSGGRRQSSYLVRGGGQTFLMDCGPTTLAALNDARVPPTDIDFVIISHLHGDHFGGVPFLLMEFNYESPRERPLTIAGPTGTEERVHELFRAMYREASAFAPTYPIHFRTLESRRPAEIGGIAIDPFAVPHQKLEPSLGFCVATEGKTIMYSGDSGWTDEFARRSSKADLFLCECCYYESKYDFHINYPDLSTHLPHINCGRLVLTHLGREVLAKLDTVVPDTAHDGMVIQV